MTHDRWAGKGTNTDASTTDKYAKFENKFYERMAGNFWSPPMCEDVRDLTWLQTNRRGGLAYWLAVPTVVIFWLDNQFPAWSKDRLYEDLFKGNGYNERQLRPEKKEPSKFENDKEIKNHFDCFWIKIGKKSEENTRETKCVCKWKQQCLVGSLKDIMEVVPVIWVVEPQKCVTCTQRSYC